MKALVLGAGVSGLSCAIRLLQAGFEVSIISREDPTDTTSAVAGAIWHPLSSAHDDRLFGWALESGTTFASLLAQQESGVVTIPLLEPLPPGPLAPRWRQLHSDITRADPATLPAGYDSGVHYTTYLIETPIYMAYLRDWFLDLGGVIIPEEVTHFDDLLAPDRLLINCAGVDAGRLLPDPAVVPIRGQVVRLAPQPWIREAFHGHGGPLGFTYIFPRSQDCILGGTQELETYSRDADPATSDAILRRCQEVLPELAGAKILDARVGIRPGRHAVRLEREERPGGVVIHNYGHGGIGVTLSWGCAADVVRLALTSGN